MYCSTAAQLWLVPLSTAAFARCKGSAAAAHCSQRQLLLADLARLWLQVQDLRERLQEEHQALLQRDAQKAALEQRIARLTKIILHSTRVHAASALARRQRIRLLRSFSAHPSPAVSPLVVV